MEVVIANVYGKRAKRGNIKKSPLWEDVGAKDYHILNSVAYWGLPSRASEEGAGGAAARVAGGMVGAADGVDGREGEAGLMGGLFVRAVPAVKLEDFQQILSHHIPKAISA